MIRRDKEDFLDDYNRLIDINVIKDVISEFEEDLNRLEKYKNYYVGKVNYQLPKELQGLLPNNLNVNFAKEIGLSIAKTLKQIKNRIGDVRICKGISQRKLAKIINVSNQAISAYECGIRKPNKQA